MGNASSEVHKDLRQWAFGLRKINGSKFENRRKRRNLLVLRVNKRGIFILILTENLNRFRASDPHLEGSEEGVWLM